MPVNGSLYTKELPYWTVSSQKPDFETISINEWIVQIFEGLEFLLLFFPKQKKRTVEERIYGILVSWVGNRFPVEWVLTKF